MGYTIKKKSRWWYLIPLSGRNRFSATLGDTIYLTPERFDDFESGSPRNSTVALIEHEKVHVDQFRRDKHFKRRYLTSRKWRLKYEAEAYAKQAYIRVKFGGKKRDERVVRYARILSSLTYLLFMPMLEVAKVIDAEYEKLAQGREGR